MENLVRDLRYAARMLLRTPGFTAAAVLCLALGIGANSAVFSVVNAVLLRSLPFAEPERIVMIHGSGGGLERQPSSAAELLDYREQSRLFEQVSSAVTSYMNLTGVDEPERLVGGRISANLFQLLGVQPAIGRGFRPEEEQDGNHRVVVLGDGLWRRRFGADPAVIGQQVSLGGEPYEIVGVMPPQFEFRFSPLEPDLWVPHVLDPARLPQRDFRAIHVAARLKPGISLEQAQAEVDALARRFLADHPQFYPGDGWRIVLTPIHDLLVGEVRLGLLVLFGAVGLVLLIACVNVANLMLARATAREKEVALRTAIGASRGGLIRQFLAESLLLACWGGLLGLALAWWALKILVAFNPDKLPRLEEIGPDVRGLAFTALVTLATGLAFGLIPAIRASRGRLHHLLKEGGKTSAVGTGRHRLRSALVVAEVALGLVVLVGAGLVVRSYLRLQEVDAGFRTDRLLTLQVHLTPAKYPEEPERGAVAARILERLQALPGVEQVALASTLPMAELRFLIETEAEGRPPQPGDPPIMPDWRPVNADYFQVMGIPLLRGRAFGAADALGAPQVVIVNDVLAERLWPGEDPIGKRLRLLRPSGKGGWPTVVGVVRQVRAVGLDTDPGEQMYTPLPQTPFPFMAVAVRTSADPLSLAPSVRRVIASVDPDLPVDKVRSMEQVMAESVAGRRAYALLLGVFAGVALVLVAIGVYGVMAYSVAQRVQEIGIRMALGAQPGEVVRMVVRQGLALAGLGVGVGLVLALWSSRFVAKLLFGIAATDALTFSGVTLTLLSLALLATWLPARRATHVDPQIALRWE